MLGVTNPVPGSGWQRPASTLGKRSRAGWRRSGGRRGIKPAAAVASSRLHDGQSPGEESAKRQRRLPNSTRRFQFGASE